MAPWKPTNASVPLGSTCCHSSRKAGCMTSHSNPKWRSESHTSRLMGADDVVCACSAVRHIDKVPQGFLERSIRPGVSASRVDACHPPGCRGRVHHSQNGETTAIAQPPCVARNAPTQHMQRQPGLLLPGCLAYIIWTVPQMP